ncbi:Uncharacterized protein CLAVI_000246 [Candidatus Clavichlamydia salmonicola]|uniref:toxin-antitoxin system YwqK family antitoxin n=1 Tax=Candidatus Clavichlamydia salmonicola TaxID=469812 RepID=UPI0018914615|nr:hypothetical protein [Candidatus Clavichlamydia salmonicola]MBF5050632.1 Uncharacterized protein [Candidatus Clavichlamydia salmonicola]
MKCILNNRCFFYFLTIQCFLGSSFKVAEAAPYHQRRSCPSSYTRRRAKKERIPISINIIDRNGLSETITAKDRLRSFGKIDFLSPQSYQKVMRTFRTKSGITLGLITTYHPNGQLKQYLETRNTSAYGSYKEWFSDGNKKLETYVTGGIPDISPSAERSWLFDGISYAWNESGTKIAEIHYTKGSLEGLSYHYHANSQVWKICPFKKGQLHGIFAIYKNTGELLQSIPFYEGKRHGVSQRFWSKEQKASEEIFDQDLLITGDYFNPHGLSLSSIRKGNGVKAIFSHSSLYQTQEHKQGKPDGLVTIFDPLCKHISQTYHIHNQLKDGPELFFYPESSNVKLKLHWVAGLLNGSATSYYPDGKIKSEKEFQENKKQGILSCYYPNGDLMLIEEYSKDLLVKGEYFSLGDINPSSKVTNGLGTASIFNEEGKLILSIFYQDGLPEVD